MSPEQVQARRAAVLDELIELGMTLARDQARRALESEDDRTSKELALASARMARWVRQSLALEARLARDELAVGKAVREQAEAAVRIHRQRVEARVERCIWNEVEKPEADEMDEAQAQCRVQMLAERLDLDETDPDFLNHSVDAHVARLCAALGLAPPAATSPFAAPDAAPEKPPDG